MKFISFRIRNYKGIQDTTIKLNGSKGSIYTLVGLNESGKTTILEAINNFYPDVEGAHAIAQKSISTEPIEALVPKKHKDNFNGEISVEAKLVIDKDDIVKLTELCKSEYGFQIDAKTFSPNISVKRRHIFENSEFIETRSSWKISVSAKSSGARKIRILNSEQEEWQQVIIELRKLFPRIVYFPTFLFDFPEKILISDGECDFEGNEYFKQMVEDALASLDDPLELQKHIIDRVIKKDAEIPFASWLPTWMRSDERERVSSVLDKLSRKLTIEIFGRWADVLGTDPGQKELVIEDLVEDSESAARRVFLEFKVKDGYTKFKISERSLGFRWFFCFLLFTRFIRGSGTGGCIFLFDEPASNLHSKAQTKLLDSLEVITDGDNDIIYSTHSHHLINPLWLETTFIITNGIPNSGESLDADFVVEDSDIHAQSYKHFVGQNAEKSHYFQPILDRLQVSPSLLEATREGVFTEGKSDFYILNWYKKYRQKQTDLDFVPVGGANNASALMSLYLGLSLRFVLLLDSDSEGNKAKKNYLNKLPISENSIIQIGDVFQTPRKKKIEDLISNDTKSAIKQKYGITRIRKSHILRAFSEALSGQNDLPDDEETLNNLKLLVDQLSTRLREL